MTANQIAYQANLETMRANRERERENKRSNMANEELTRARDFSKEPTMYALYGAANSGQKEKGKESSAVNVVAKHSDTINDTTVKGGLKSIFSNMSRNIAQGIEDRNEARSKINMPFIGGMRYGKQF